MKGMSIPVSAPAIHTKIAAITITPTDQQTDTGDPGFKFKLSLQQPPEVTGTGKHEYFDSELKGGVQSLHQGAAQIALLTKPGSVLRPHPAMKIQAAMQFRMDRPSFSVDDNDIEPVTAENRRRREAADRAMYEFLQEEGIKQFKLLKEVAAKMAETYRSLDEPVKLGEAAKGFLIAEQERKLIADNLAKPTVSPGRRPSPRM